jgi:hypothetical protein
MRPVGHSARSRRRVAGLDDRRRTREKLRLRIDAGSPTEPLLGVQIVGDNGLDGRAYYYGDNPDWSSYHDQLTLSYVEQHRKPALPARPGPAPCSPQPPAEPATALPEPAAGAVASRWRGYTRQPPRGGG